MNQKQLWDKLAKKNSKYYIASFMGKKITEEEFRDSGCEDTKKYILNDPIIKKEGVCLEIGCGIGRMTEFIADLFQKTIGIDISGEMIKQARYRLVGNDITLLESDGEKVDVADESIDFAFSYIVFQHFKTKKMLESNFKEVYRVLKSNGMFKVLVRLDKVDVSKWWGGVFCDESVPIKIGFKVLKTEKVKSYGLWLWLQK